MERELLWIFLKLFFEWNISFDIVSCTKNLLASLECEENKLKSTRKIPREDDNLGQICGVCVSSTSSENLGQCDVHKASALLVLISAYKQGVYRKMWLIRIIYRLDYFLFN